MDSAPLSGMDAKRDFIIGLGCGHLNEPWVTTSDIALTSILLLVRNIYEELSVEQFI